MVFMYRSLNSKVPTASRRQLARVARPQVKEKRITGTRDQNRFKRQKKKYNEGFKLALVALHYGSLNDFSRVVKSVYVIARELNMHYGVVERACSNYRKYGVVTRPNRKGNPRGFSEEHMAAMIGPEALESNKFLSTEERCENLFRDHGLWLTPAGLRAIYKRHGIGFRFARTQARSIIRREPRTTVDRKEVADQLLSLVAANLDACYIDEVNFQVSLEVIPSSGDPFLCSKT